MDDVPSVFLQSRFGAVSALTFDILNDIDPDMAMGLYIDTACFASRKLVAQAGSLNKFTGQHKRLILLGPDNCSHPVQIKSKKHFTQVQYSNSTVYEYFNAKEFVGLINDLKPTFFVLPNPLPLPKSLTGASPKPSDIILHCNASTDWLAIADTAKNALIAVTEETLRYNDPLPKPELYASYLDVISKSKGPFFLPYLSQLPVIRDVCKARGYPTRIVVASGSTLVSLLTALQYESVSVITDIVSLYSEQGIAITVPLDLFTKQVEVQEDREPLRKHTIGTGVYPSETKEHRMLTYLDSSMYATDQEPLDKTCPCLGCKRPKAYLRHLYTTHELTGLLLVAAHNVTWIKRFLLLRQRCLELHGPSLLSELVRSMLSALAH